MIEIEYEMEYNGTNDEYEFFTVLFYGNPSWANNSASYSRPHDRLICEDITWDETKHPESQNKIITDFLSIRKNYIEVESKLCDLYTEKYDLAEYDV